MPDRWKVRKWRNYGLAKINIWEVFEPDGTCSASFYDWHQAMEWATSIGARLGRWKVYKVRQGFWAGYWIAQPPDADFDSSFEFANHATALHWAANPMFRLDYWLEHQR